MVELTHALRNQYNTDDQWKEETTVRLESWSGSEALWGAPPVCLPGWAKTLFPVLSSAHDYSNWLGLHALPAGPRTQPFLHQAPWEGGSGKVRPALRASWAPGCRSFTVRMYQHLRVPLGTGFLLMTETQRNSQDWIPGPCGFLNYHRSLPAKKTKARKCRNYHFGKTIKVVKQKSTERHLDF